MRITYEGSVAENGKEIARCWRGETIATTLAKGIANLKYQFNKQRGKSPYCKIQFNENQVKVRYE